MNAASTLLAIDDLQYDLDCAIDMVGTIHIAMTEGTNTAESYLNSLFGTYNYLLSINKELRRILDNRNKENKTEEK